MTYLKTLIEHLPYEALTPNMVFVIIVLLVTLPFLTYAFTKLV